MKHLRTLTGRLTCGLLFLSLTWLAQAQTSTGSISGRVLDASGSAVAGADVRAVNTATTDQRTTKTNATGAFIFTNVDPGDYSLVVSATGFKQLDKTNLHLAASDALAAGDLQLQVGNVSEKVEVVANAGQ